jgi:lipopolysaccharide/colanic/teichoic acid biosynthesis glycosyltransferase
MSTTLSAGQAIAYAPASVRAFESAGRRILNIFVAALGLLVSAPLMLCIAALIKLTSRGPVLFCQTRIGLDRRSGRSANGGRFVKNGRNVDYGGRPFTIYKFRTMYTQHCDRQDQVWARPDDERVTTVGRVLRRLRLDELPQLLNVLLGDMNVVGPRPEQPEIFLRLREQLPGYTARQRVRPGITGLAQVERMYDRTLDDVRQKVALDVDYIRRQSVRTDFTIMLRTPGVMLRRKNGW